MGKRVFIYIITILVVGFVLYLNIAPGRPVIKLDEFDHYVNENSFNKYDINFIRVRKDDSNIVDYYLKVNGKYYVVFDEKEYKNIDPVQLDIESTYENKYIDFYIYDEYGNKIDVIKVYYSQNYEKLTHLFWSSYDETIIYLIVFGITFLMILSDLIVYLLTRKRKPKVLSPNIKESFRNAPLNKKIGYLVILLIYLVLPFPFLLIFGIALFFVIIFYVGGFLHKLKGVLLSLLILLVGVGVFFTFYLVFVPEALRDYEYEVPEMSLSDAGTKAYHKLIDDSEFYHKEPVAYYENNDFGFVALRTYIEWDYSSGDPISVCFKFRFYKIGNFREKDYYVVLRKDELIIAEVYYDGQNEIIIESLEESMLYFEVRKSQNNDLVYTSDEFPMKKDFYNQDEEIYYGGQYMENSKKVTILFFVFTHLSAIVTGLLLYIFRNFIFVNMKVNRKQLFFGKLFKGEA